MGFEYHTTREQKDGEPLTASDKITRPFFLSDTFNRGIASRLLVTALAILVVMSGAGDVRADSIQTAIDDGVDWLVSRQGPYDCWANYDISITNALAVRAFVATGNTSSSKYQPALDKLIEIQAPDGSWDEDVSATSHAIWALIDAGQDPGSPMIASAVAWLKGQQSSDGSWDYYTWKTSRALIALVKAGVSTSSPEIIDAVNWLKTSQNPDGYWGIQPGGDSTMGYNRGYPVVALCFADSPTSPEVSNAVDWLVPYANHTTENSRNALEAFIAANSTANMETARNATAEAQNDDDGWSLNSSLPSMNFSTARAVILLAEAGHVGAEIGDGLIWIENHINTEGIYTEWQEVVHYTAWAVSGLAATGTSTTQIQEAIGVFVDKQSYGGGWGWHSIYVKGNGGPVPITGSVLWSFYNSGLHSSYPGTMQAAADFLVNAQNDDDGWGYYSPSALLSASTISDTNYAMTGLISAGYTVSNQTIIDGLDYLLLNRTGSNWGSAWETALATIILHRLDTMASEKEDAIDWLKANQNSDGGWGAVLGESSTVDSTSMVLIALSMTEMTGLETYKGVSWLLAAGNSDGGWSNLPGIPASNTTSTALAIWALSVNEAPGPPYVVITTDKEEYNPGETVEITAELSEPVCNIEGTVTKTDGSVDVLSLNPLDPNTYIAYYVVPSIPTGTCTISVVAYACDDRMGAGNGYFNVLYYPGPEILMREPKVEDNGVHTNLNGVENLRLLWSEPVVFGNTDVSITDANDMAVSFLTYEINPNPQIMQISFDKTLKYDKYTITIHDTVVSAATGRAIDGDGDGVAGGDAVLVMEHRERYDSDNDNDLDLIDFVDFANKWLWIINDE